MASHYSQDISLGFTDEPSWPEGLRGGGGFGESATAHEYKKISS